MSSNLHTATGIVLYNLGSASVPIICNSTSSNTGIYYPTSTSVGISISGNLITTVNSMGLGVGITPSYPLQINAAAASANIQYGAHITGTTTSTNTTHGGMYNNITFAPPNGSTYSIGHQMGNIFAAPTSQTISNACGIYISNSYTGNLGTVANSYGILCDTGGANVGTINNAYGGYFINPSTTVTGGKTALYADNMCIGYTGVTPPTNGSLFKGSVSIGTSSSVLGGGACMLSQANTSAILDNLVPALVIQNTNTSSYTYLNGLFFCGPTYATAAICSTQGTLVGGVGNVGGQLRLSTKYTTGSSWNSSQLVLDPSGIVCVGVNTSVNTNSNNAFQVGNIGTVLQSSFGMVNSLFRIREFTTINNIGLSTNIDSSQNLDNTSFSSWNVNFGGGGDYFNINRYAPANSTSPVTLLNLTGAGQLNINKSTSGNIINASDGTRTVTMGINSGSNIGYVITSSNHNLVLAANNAAAQLTVVSGGGIQINGLTTNGTVVTTGGTGTLSVSSDIRIKNNINYLDDTYTGLDKVMDMKPCKFQMNGDIVNSYLGFIAQDLEIVEPLIVDGKKYEYELIRDVEGNVELDANGNPQLDMTKPRYRGVSDRAIIAILVKAIQELNNKLQSVLDK
jgi:hypothetical protein